MNQRVQADLEILVLTGLPSDAQAACRVLEAGGVSATRFETFETLCERLRTVAGALLLDEECLLKNDFKILAATLSEQEPWSDIPIVLMVLSKTNMQRTQELLDRLPSANLILVERPCHIVTLMTGIKTALKARERQYQVRTLICEQRQALQKRDEFLSIASHELRTPITAMKLHVQTRKKIVARGDPNAVTEGQFLSLLDSVEKQTNRMSRLVDDMFDLSRIESGKLSLSLEPVNLCELTLEVIESFSAQLTVAQCPIKFKYEADVIGNWDKYRIEQVISNLLNNSIKYGARGEIIVAVTKQENIGCLEVKDRGMGIAPENHQRIFDRFERAVSFTNISGLGLGLYIARQIVELHGGEIKLQSALNEGATFRVHLPLAVGAAT